MMGELAYCSASGVTKMHGPRFNSSTQAVCNAAHSATVNTIVQQLPASGSLAPVTLHRGGTRHAAWFATISNRNG